MKQFTNKNYQRSQNKYCSGGIPIMNSQMILNTETGALSSPPYFPSMTQASFHTTNNNYRTDSIDNTHTGVFLDSRDNPVNHPKIEYNFETDMPQSVVRTIPLNVYQNPCLGRKLMQILAENSSLNHKKLSEWSLIGTHNSMTGNGRFLEYGGIAQPWAQNQILRFNEQMWSGVRHFDIRPIYMGQGIFQFHHGGWTIANYTLDDMVYDIDVFLHNNPNEILQLSMSHFEVHSECRKDNHCNLKYEEDVMVAFMKEIEKKMESFLIHKRDIKSTYHSLIRDSTRRRVATVYNTKDHLDESNSQHSYFRWKDIERDAIRDSCENYKYASWYDYAIMGNGFYYAESPHNKGEGFNPEITNHNSVKKYVVQKIQTLSDKGSQVLVQAFQMREQIYTYFSAAMPIKYRFLSNANNDILHTIMKRSKHPVIVVLDLWNPNSLGYYLGIIKTKWKFSKH